MIIVCLAVWGGTKLGIVLSWGVISEPRVMGFYNFSVLHRFRDGTICKLHHYGAPGLGLAGDSTTLGMVKFGDCDFYHCGAWDCGILEFFTIWGIEILTILGPGGWGWLIASFIFLGNVPFYDFRGL